MKIAIYTRVSTTDKNQDTKNQALQLVEYCSRNNYEIVKEYTDHVSGSKGRDKRPGFDSMMNDARLKKFDTVLVWALDRFTREGVFKCLVYIKKLEEYKVGFISHQEEYLNTLGPWKDALIAIMATLAHQERCRISDRVKAGLEKAKSEGTMLGRRPVDKRKGEIDIINKYAEGMSIRKIATACNVGISTVQRVMSKHKKK